MSGSGGALQLLGSSTASAEESVVAAMYSMSRSHTQFTIVVTSDLDCTLTIEFLDDLGAYSTLETESIVTADGTHMFAYAGNPGRWRATLSRVGATAWTTAIYGQGN